MIYRMLIISFCILGMVLTGCKKEAIIEPPNNSITNHYLHISHTRTNANPFMDNMVERVDYSEFDMLWLGGDLAYLTSNDDLTMSRVDSIFDIGNPNTLWSLGNHDYSDLSRIQAYTSRPASYTYHDHGITFIVLDTQDSLSNIVGGQKALFDSVVDTLQTSSHLVVLHHKLIWMYGDVELEPQISLVSNGGLGDCFYCINPNNFYTAIYPKLTEVKQRGIEVLFIGGDIGFHAKEFEYTTPHGIHFLASGIAAGDEDNKALLFSHDLTNRQLTWQYKLISDL